MAPGEVGVQKAGRRGASHTHTSTLNFTESAKAEVRHSPAPIGLGAPDEGCSYRRVVCARTAGVRVREGLGHRDGAERRAGARFVGAPAL
jgi:hypothetical protein